MSIENLVPNEDKCWATWCYYFQCSLKISLENKLTVARGDEQPFLHPARHSSQRNNTGCCEETSIEELSVLRVSAAVVVTPRSIKAHSWQSKWQRNSSLKFVLGKRWLKSVPALINPLCWFSLHFLLEDGCHLY